MWGAQPLVLIIKALDIQNVAGIRSPAIPEVDTTIISTRGVVTVVSTLRISLVTWVGILTTLCHLEICVSWKILF
jgi:hypothetical protein